MASISNHLHVKPYQIAVTNDKTLPIRKWNHLGTFWDVSAISAIYQMRTKRGKDGDIIGRSGFWPIGSEGQHHAIECEDGEFVAVH